jgi:hypothetical protein
MAYAYVESRIMPKQSIASILSTTAALPVGTIVRAKDPTLGEGEFIYLPTTASITQFNLTSWRQNISSGTYTNVRAVSGTVLGTMFGVAQATGAASCFGWFQISGTSKVLKSAVIVSVNKPVAVSTTAGRIRQIASAGRGIVGMVANGTGAATNSAASAGLSTVVCTFNRPAQMAT